MNVVEIQSLLERAVTQGGEKALAVLPTITSHISKGRGDFATQADLQSEQVIMELLRKEASHVPIVSEETGLQEVPAGEFFAVDPLDGTIISSRGCPEWGVCASYIRDGEVLAAACFQPELQQTVVATKGGGCWLNGKQLKFSQSSVPERYIISVDVSYATISEDISRYLYQPAVAGRLLISRSVCCAVANTVELLTNRIDIYVASGGGKVWDYSGTDLMVSEAGGAGCGFDRKKLRWTKLQMGGIFAQSQAALDDFLALTTRV